MQHPLPEIGRCTARRRHAAVLCTLYASLLLTVLGGCAAPGSAPRSSSAAVLGETARPPAPIELTEVPFHPQSRWQCGPAALATVLGASGLEADPDALVDEVWIPERRGALAVELLAATRRAGRLAYPLDPTFGALLAELQAGRPVLVMQNLGLAWLPVWHFAVVIGFDPDTDTVILRSGREARRRMPLVRFDRSWAHAQRWAMVALRAGELPAQIDRDRLLGAAAAVERVDQVALAHAAYGSWLERTPGDAAARFGLATTAHALGDRRTAISAYRTLLERRPDDVRVLNNLALVLHEEGDAGTAERLLEQALKLTEEAAVRSVLQDSLETVRGHAEQRGPGMEPGPSE